MGCVCRRVFEIVGGGRGGWWGSNRGIVGIKEEGDCKGAKASEMINRKRDEGDVVCVKSLNHSLRG
jgi:hypothetical protein